MHLSKEGWREAIAGTISFMMQKANDNILFIWVLRLNRVKLISCAALPQRLSA
jgi:hypothetical protein